MKKLLFSILAVGMSLVGCTDWDDAVSENYGSGPAISVNIDATTDYGFTFTLSPASGTVFYSYIVAEGDTPAALDGQALLKQQYSGLTGGLLNATENSTYTLDLSAEEACEPNTSYVVYAVAASKEGVVGSVASAVVTTSDAGVPYPTKAQVLEEGIGVQVAFSEAVAAGEGKVTAQYFAEWTGEFIDVPAEEMAVAVTGNVVTVAFDSIPASATVLVSWEAGAFVDAKANPCPAMISGINEAGDDFDGVFFDVADAPFAIAEENATAPKIGDSFGDWEETMFVFEFDMDLYRNDKALTGEELQVTYTHEGKTTTINVPSNYWAVQGNALLFFLPEAPDFGDWVSLTIAEGAFSDVYGNPNQEVTLENAWLCSYGYERELIIGNYTLSYYSYAEYSATKEFVPVTEKITIEADPENENGVLLSGFLGLNEKVSAEFNGDFGTLYLEEQPVGVKNVQGTDYIFTIYGNSADYSLTLNIAADGTLTCENDLAFLYGVYDMDFNYVTDYDGAISPEFVKDAVAARSVAPMAKPEANFNIANFKNGGKFLK